MSNELTILATAGIVVLGILIAVWLVRSRTKVPVTVRIRKLDAEDVPPHLAPVLDEYDTELATLGFEKAGEFVVSEHESENPHRVYIHPKENTLAMVSPISIGLGKKPHLEFYTRLTDDKSLSTDLALIPNFLALPANRVVQRLPGVLSATQLWERHKTKLDEMKIASQGTQRLNKDQVYKTIESDQQELIEFQAKSGLFTIDEEANVMRPTWKFAFYFIFKILDPLPLGVSTGRLVLSVAVAAAVLFGFFYAARSEQTIQMLNSLPLNKAQVQYLASNLGAVIAGIFLGWSIRYKGVLWAGVIALAEFALIRNVYPNSFIAILICAYAGMVGNRIAEYQMTKILSRFMGPLIILAGLLIVGWVMFQQ